MRSFLVYVPTESSDVIFLVPLVLRSRHSWLKEMARLGLTKMERDKSPPAVSRTPRQETHRRQENGTLPSQKRSCHVAAHWESRLTLALGLWQATQGDLACWRDGGNLRCVSGVCPGVVRDTVLAFPFKVATQNERWLIFATAENGAQPTPRHGAHFQKTTSANMGNSSKYDNELEISIPPHWLPP